MKKTWARYINKIILVVRQEGFFTAVKKLFLVLFNILYPVKNGDILFISSGLVGDSSRYRVLNVAEELQLHGFKCSCVIQEYSMLMSCADKFNIFIFHKVSFAPQIQEFIKKIKEKNKEIIFETDDLLFDPEFIKQQDFFRNANAVEKRFFENGIGAEMLNDPYVKACSTSTSFLAGKLQEHNKQVFVVSNKLSVDDLEIAEKINLKITRNNPEMIRIGYFSGTASHNKDFATVAEPLMQIMEKYRYVELFLAGPLDTENRLNKFSDRIRQFSFVSREKHFANIAGVDINIAPLEIGNPFCESRSELKFFEAGIVKVPTVAAATQTFREAIADGEDGFIVNRKEEWFEKLEKLIVNGNLRKEMGEKAYQKAVGKYSIKNSSNEEYYKYLKSKLR